MNLLIPSILALSIPLFIVLSLVSRMRANKGAGKGIGWQFIRYNVIVVSLLLIGVLALNDAISGEVTTVIAGALGYSFGKSDDTPETSL